MGMGYCASYADTISEEDIKKICGVVAEKFFNKFNYNEGEKVGRNEDLYAVFAKEACYDCEDLREYCVEEEVDEIRKTYNELQKNFNEKTGLDLLINYHYFEEGDRYDEVDGVFWDVNNAYQLTPEAKKLIDSGIKIDRKFYVTFG